MKRVLALALALITMIGCMSMGASAAPAEKSAPYRNVMYYGDWSIYDCQDYFNPSDIDASLITHLNFAFLDFDANCNLILCDEYADFEAQLPEHGKDELMYDAPYSGVFGAMCLLREKNPNLKIGVSIGGWTRCGDFSVVAANPAKRELLARNLAKFIDYLGFDFLDVDWEYPCDVRPSDPEGNGVDIDEGHPHGSPADGHNFTLLMQAFRKELDALGKKNGKHYELSAAMSANTNKMKCIEYDKVLQSVDFLNMMTYDLNGSWNDYTGHQTGLYTNPAYKDTDCIDGQFSVDACIRYLKKTYGNSIDYSKIVVGVSSYTRGWAGVKGQGPDAKNPGLFVPALANSVPDEEKLKGGVYAFHDVPALCQKYGVKECYDETAQAAYLYSPDTGYFFTYDNVRSVKAKGQYVRDNGLGGLICWMASQDRDHVLTRTMKESLIGGASFPDHEIKVATPDVKVSVRAQGKNGYVFTIKNLEHSCEAGNAMKRAERFQKSVMNGKFYVTTKSGARFSAGEDGSDSGKIFNKNGTAIIDLAYAYENQVLEAGKTCTFTVKSSKPAKLDDIVSITMTQRILPSSKEFGKTLVFGSEDPVETTEAATETTVETTVPEETEVPTVPTEPVKPDPKPVAVKSVRLNAKEVVMDLDETCALKATVLPANATDKTVTWTSSNPAVAVVKDGVVTPKSAGITVITAAAVNGKKAVCKIEVMEAEQPTAPTDPAPTDPAETTAPATKPTEPKPTEPKPTEPKPTTAPEGAEWKVNTHYRVDDVVTYAGKEYVCRTEHTALPGWEPSNVPALWILKGEVKPTEPKPTKPVETEPVETEPVETEPAETEPVETKPAEGEWKVNTAYVVGDEVTYEGKTYTCRLAHTALGGWEPDKVAALWTAK